MREYGADLGVARLCCLDVRPMEPRTPVVVRLGHNSLRARFDSLRQLHDRRRNTYRNAH
jgi:hypothetical protein